MAVLEEIWASCRLVPNFGRLGVTEKKVYALLELKTLDLIGYRFHFCRNVRTNKVAVHKQNTE